MSLDPLLLDDLSWRDMVDVIRSRIAAVSGEEWTLHAPVDPGITLLELFASQFDQRSYWLDQVPDALLNGLVALLGGAPRPARAARTLFEMRGDAGDDVGADTVFGLVDGGPTLRFATTVAVALLRAERIEIATPFGTRASIDASTPRWSMEPLTLLPADGSPAEVRITLWLRQPPPQATTPFALLLDLAGPAAIPTGWSAEAVPDVPVPAALAWSFSAANAGGRTNFPAGTIDDATQGLRRSGLVRFTPGSDWAPSGVPIDGLTPYGLWLAGADCSFSAPPQLVRCVPNVATAAHAVPMVVEPAALAAQFESWLPLPGRTLTLSDKLPPLEDTVELSLRSRDGVWRDWQVAPDFARFGPEDAVLLVDRTFNCLRFADGLTGRLPVPGKPYDDAALLRYRAGGGLIGNVGSDLTWEGPVAGLEAFNPVAAHGGLETETAAEMQLRVGSDHLTRRRAVTLGDYEELAVGTPGAGVGRAHAIAGFHPGFPCVDVPGAVGVLIVPDVPRDEDWLAGDRRVDAPRPDPGMLSATRRWLDTHRLLTAEVYVVTPVYRAVEVEAVLVGSASDRAALAARLRDGLALYLDALVGGAEAGGWPFGEPVRPSEVAHVLQALAGEEIGVESAGLRFGGSEADYDTCNDLVIGRAELVVLRGLTVRWIAPAAIRGGLS